MKKIIYIVAVLAALCSCNKTEDTVDPYADLNAHRTEANTGDSEGEAPLVTASVDEYKPEGTQWVDLGLPSGKLWADRNIGANSPTEYGWHLALGETKPKTNYSPDTYWDYAGYSYTMSKWLSLPIYKMKKYNSCPLGKADDTCYKIFGGSAHTPTADEFEELFTNTNYEIKYIEPVYLFGKLIVPGAECIVCTSKDGVNQIVLPCAGHYVGKSYYPAAVNPDFVWWGPEAEYWTNSTYSSHCYCGPMPDQSYAITVTRHDLEVFGESSLVCPYPMDKFNGLSVRAVKSK